MEEPNRKSNAPALGLILTAALLRLMPHPPNIAPVGAMSLFAGARLSGWQAYVVPLLVMLITDPILGAIKGFQPFAWRTPIIYGSFMISVWIGRSLRENAGVRRVALAAFACALQFFLITNLASWWGMYEHSWAGLIACYTAALPFFGNTLIGNFAYTGLFFGIHAWLTRREAHPVVE